MTPKDGKQKPGSSASRRRPFTTPCDLVAQVYYSTIGPRQLCQRHTSARVGTSEPRNLFEGNMNLRASCWYPAAEEDRVEVGMGRGLLRKLKAATRTDHSPFSPEASARLVRERLLMLSVNCTAKPRDLMPSAQGQHPCFVHPALCITTGPFLCGAT